MSTNFTAMGVKQIGHATGVMVKQKTKKLVEIQQKNGPIDIVGIKTLQDELHVLME